ncbi:hypothetical protein NA57DRAFT_77469 [Rhizodiscina lignyota]|uniref:Oxidase ustYa n=1 Tax=Rhizodiscina lignyota TaxID=1504668 RepID=A0A9P4IDE2_9PEZI|nr:hypothetical protein NA57DRAFT_77469 [Rhizodiscina lignyota]
MKDCEELRDEKIAEEEHLITDSELGRSAEDEFFTYSSMHSGLFGWRTMVEVVAVLIFIALLFWSRRVPERTEKGYGPNIRKAIVEFGDDAHLGPDLVYADEDMFSNYTHLTELYNNWQKLYPRGRGFVKLRSSDYQFLGQIDPPYETDIFQNGTIKEGHVLTVFHSLHCLTVLMVGLGKREENSTLPIWQPHHQAHCLEYLRQSILCSADTSLEGRGKHWQVENGYGTQHICVDYAALTQWASERTPVHFDAGHKPF